MSPEPSVPVEEFALDSRFHQAVLLRFGESEAERYGMSRESFVRHVAAVMSRYGAELCETERLKLLEVLHLEDLVLARACSAGNDLAWSDFVVRFRAEMVAMARQIAHDDSAGRELADGLYADLYGMPNREGKRVSKFDYYMGRGSVKGWLRTVLAQQHVNRCRLHAKDVSLEEQVETGVSFAAKPEAAAAEYDERVSQCLAQSLSELDTEERFLLASYYLDQRTLADIGRQLRVHESTISRKLEKITDALRRRIRKRLQNVGLDRRRCEEIMQELDVRDLNIDVRANLRQERRAESFQEIDGN
jgi:RNA polymerase sigma-70 factor (ECF subfamily)